jgi:glycosyltransferase involved in cell wall biosynthesis
VTSRVLRRAEPARLGPLFDGQPRERQGALAARIRTLVQALGVAPPSDPHLAVLPAILERALTGARAPEAWLAVAVLTGRLPDPPTVQRTHRTMRLDGPVAALLQALQDSGQLERDEWPDVEVITGRVVVDVHHTARTEVATGIQRVARETVRRWSRDHSPVLLGWTNAYTALRRLSANEIDTALNGRRSAEDVRADDGSGVVVPWRCTHLLPELLAEPERALRYEAVAAFSRSASGLIGFDCVPLMAAETAAQGMPGGFASYLSAAGQVDRVATISESSAVEYRGWRTMLAGAGKSGPRITAISLPIEGRVPTEAARRTAREMMAVGPLPVVLVVGSHEPRKNHLAVLHAAEVLWREGLLFSLTFVGGNSWNSERFDARVDALRDAGRPVQTIRALPDDILWGAYHVAYCTVFPSLHEGFGLPAAESLASGTPVITSNYGSMREIARHGGALLVDPRNDAAIADALRGLLRDPNLRNELAGQAGRHPQRSWDEYAEQVWRYLVVDADVPSVTAAPV